VLTLAPNSSGKGGIASVLVPWQLSLEPYHQTILKRVQKKQNRQNILQ
jgi:hypothetical protein